MSIHAWLARHVIYPTHERSRGRATLRELDALRRQTARCPDTCLRDLLTFANEKLPYYRDLFARCGVDPRGDSPLAELARLPTLEKADIRQNAERMVWRDVPGGLIPHSSGGTTGDTLHFFIDRVRQAQTHAARLFMQGLFGVR